MQLKPGVSSDVVLAGLYKHTRLECRYVVAFAQAELTKMNTDRSEPIVALLLHTVHAFLPNELLPTFQGFAQQR